MISIFNDVNTILMRHGSAVPWQKRARCGWREGGLKTMHHIDGGRVVQCHGRSKRSAVGEREVLATVHRG